MSDVRRIEAATSWASITVNTAVNICRGVYIGTAADYDFSFDGATTWVKFTGCVAGSILPIAASGVRVNAGGGAPAAGAIVFLY